MKKIFIATMVLLICVLMAGCSKSAPATTATKASPTAAAPATTSTPAPTLTTTPAPTPTPTKTTEAVPAPTPGPNSLVVSRDVFTALWYQTGEIRVAPGDTFSVNLATYKAYDRIWGETPEIINEDAVELVGFKNSPADVPLWQTWTFKALDEGSCVVHFKTGKPDLEVMGWTYDLSVGVLSPSVSTIVVNYTTVKISSEKTDDTTDGVNLVNTMTIHDTGEIHGTMEGKIDTVTKLQTNLMTGGWLERIQSTFTGEVSGKSGSFTRYLFSSGYVDPKNRYQLAKTGFAQYVGAIVSGTGDLAKLRGTIYYALIAGPVEPATDPPTYQYVGNPVCTIWFLE
jgi:hypothetical protein